MPRQTAAQRRSAAGQKGTPKPRAPKAPAAPATPTMVRITAVKMDYAAPEPKGYNNSQQTDLRNGIAFRSADNEMTIRFSCGDTVVLSINEFQEILNLVRESDPQSETDFSQLIDS